jgi:hypothetical protein
MLIQQVVGAFSAAFVQRALGSGSAKPRAVRVSLLRRLFPLSAFPESLQVDHVPHGCLHHAIDWGRAKFFLKRKQSRRAGSVVIGILVVAN